MNKKDFVTFEQAQKLKGLGFKEKCLCHYNKDGLLFSNSDFDCEGGGIYIENLKRSYNNKNKNYIDSPTLAQAHHWIISKGLLVVPYSMSFESWQCRVCKKGETFLSSKLYEDFYSYEEALSNGISECLKILENEN